MSDNVPQQPDATIPPKTSDSVADASLYERLRKEITDQAPVWAEQFDSGPRPVVGVADAAAVAARVLVPALADLARLRAGEADDPGPRHSTAASPAHWLRRWNDLEPEKRLQMAAWIMKASETAERCFQMHHEYRLERAEAAIALVRQMCERAKANAAEWRAEHGQYVGPQIDADDVLAALAGHG